MKIKVTITGYLPVNEKELSDFGGAETIGEAAKDTQRAYKTKVIDELDLISWMNEDGFEVTFEGKDG